MECLEKRKHWERDETDGMSLTNVNEKAISWMPAIFLLPPPEMVLKWEQQE